MGAELVCVSINPANALVRHKDGLVCQQEQTVFQWLKDKRRNAVSLFRAVWKVNGAQEDGSGTRNQPG